MAANLPNTRNEETKAYKIYLERSKQFYEESNVAAAAGRWAAVGLNSVHCSISMCDALTVRFLNKRSIATDHRLAVDVLSMINVDGIEQQLANYKRIINKKYAVAYENRVFKEKEAIELMNHVERFYQWGLSKLQD